MKKMNGSKLRKGRYSEINNAYIVTTVTLNREKLFLDFNLARLIIAEIQSCQIEKRIENLTWVIMPDHIHWLFILKEGSISSVMQRVKAKSALSINDYLSRNGRVWQKGFYDQAVRKESEIKPIARYIIANPIRAGLVDKVGDYPYWDACWL